MKTLKDYIGINEAAAGTMKASQVEDRWGSLDVLGFKGISKSFVTFSSKPFKDKQGQKIIIRGALLGKINRELFLPNDSMGSKGSFDRVTYWKELTITADGEVVFDKR